MGWKTERLASWRIPGHLKNVEDPAIYGEALFASALAEQFGLVLSNPPEDWLVKLPHEYKLRNSSITTLGEARTRSEQAFIKPPNDKSFPAGIYRGDELPAEFEQGMSVLISEVVQREREFRCFVLDRRLETFSLYSRHGELQREQGFESEPVSGWAPHLDDGGSPCPRRSERLMIQISHRGSRDRRATQRQRDSRASRLVAHFNWSQRCMAIPP